MIKNMLFKGSPSGLTNVQCNSSQLQYDMLQVPGLNPAWGYGIDRPKLETISHYSNSRAPSGL